MPKTSFEVLQPKYEKPDFCSACPITRYTKGYVPFVDSGSTRLIIGKHEGKEEVIQGRSFAGGTGVWLKNMITRSGGDLTGYNKINVIGCCPPDDTMPGDREWKATPRAVGRAGVAYCKQHHLDPVLRSKPWTKIIALGNEALEAVTNRRGILQWRGSPLQATHLGPEHPPIVMPTLHPAFLMRKADMSPVVYGDLRKSMSLPPEDSYKLYATVEDLQRFESKSFAFDLEWDRNKEVTLVGLSDAYGSGIVIDPRSSESALVQQELKRIFENATNLIGHNIVSADLPFIDKFGFDITHATLWDTMLMQHLVQPNYPHSLAFTCSVFTNAVFWKGKDGAAEDEDGEIVNKAQWRTWENQWPQGIPRKYGGYLGCNSADEAYRLYNCRDTVHNYAVWQPLLRELERYNQTPVYKNVSLPMAIISRWMETTGWRIDPSCAKSIRDDMTREIDRLQKVLPKELQPYEKQVTRNIPAPEGTWKEKFLKCRGSKKENTTHESVNIRFTRPGRNRCSICGSIKDSGKMVEAKIIKVPATETIVPWRSQQQILEYADSKGIKPEYDRKTKGRTANKYVRAKWSKAHGEFGIINEITKYDTVRSNFARESLQQIVRMHFRTNVVGTREGRTSASGSRRGIDLNIQQQPDAVKRMYLPDAPGFALVQADWKSGENFLTAWFAQDWERIDRMRVDDFDEHSEYASEFFQEEVVNDKNHPNYHLRKPGKIINHSLGYGASWKSVAESLGKEGYYYPDKEVKYAVELWRKKNSAVYQWQLRTGALAAQQGYLENPFGRRLWFQNRDFHTKALAFLPASTLADMKIRCCIALYPNWFPRELQELKLHTVFVIPKDYRIIAEIHDEIITTGPDESHRQMAIGLKAVMTQPWKELDGFYLDVAVEYGTKNWLEMEELKL